MHPNRGASPERLVYGQLTRLSPRCVRVWLRETTLDAWVSFRLWRSVHYHQQHSNLGGGVTVSKVAIYLKHTWVPPHTKHSEPNAVSLKMYIPVALRWFVPPLVWLETPCCVACCGCVVDDHASARGGYKIHRPRALAEKPGNEPHLPMILVYTCMADVHAHAVGYIGLFHAYTPYECHLSQGWCKLALSLGGTVSYFIVSRGY